MVSAHEHTFTSPELQQFIDQAVEFFGGTPAHQLPPSGAFEGTGVYALYYRGSFAPYQVISSQNQSAPTQPIYVGKAVSAGWRTGRTTAVGKELYSRLRQHARSIEQAQNLALEEFQCRFMILIGTEVNLIGTVEAAIIRKFTPIWNTLIDGFGNHDPGKGRYNQRWSEWDALHPGRAWAERLTGQRPEVKTIIEKLNRRLL